MYFTKWLISNLLIGIDYSTIIQSYSNSQPCIVIWVSCANRNVVNARCLNNNYTRVINNSFFDHFLTPSNGIDRSSDELSTKLTSVISRRNFGCRLFRTERRFLLVCICCSASCHMICASVALIPVMLLNRFNCSCDLFFELSSQLLSSKNVWKIKIFISKK